MPECKALGATLVAIAPQLPEFSRELIEQHKLGFNILFDKGNQVAEQFGLKFKLDDPVREFYTRVGVNLDKFNGDDSWTLPIPGSFVIDSSGRIRKASVDPDYTSRPEPGELVEALKSIERA